MDMIIGFLLVSFIATVSSFDEMAMQRTKCITYCKESNELICGSDEKTYHSRCHLAKAACELRKDIRFLHPGPCECPTTCLKNYKPVCAEYRGTEKTYVNICEFKREYCKIKDHSQSLTYKRAGPCRPMKGWKSCPPGCNDIYAPVCGGDGVSYSSVCALKLTSCRSRKKIKITSIGLCASDRCPQFCPFNYRPICGTDGNLYPSECEMKLTACKMGKVIKRAKKEAKKACKKKCVVYCPDNEKLVCGPNNETYLNMCAIKRSYCLKGQFVKRKEIKEGQCKKMPNNTPIKK